MVYGYFYLKEEYKLKGIYLNGCNLNLLEGYKGYVSCFCYLLDEVKECKFSCDYVFLSLVFNSIFKLNYNLVYIVEEFCIVVKVGIIDKKVIVLGGIDEENLLEVKDFGFGGVVILGVFWNKFDVCIDCDYWCVIEYFWKLRDLVD